MELSDLLAPLDWGRQGLVNTGEGLSGLAGGDFSRHNFAKIMPGVAGLGAGLLTGGTMAAPAAALTMALTQGIGKQFNPTDMKAQTTQDLLGKLGGDPDSTWQNIGMGLATDPFTYAGLGTAGGLARGGEAANLASAASKAGTATDAIGTGLGAADAAVAGRGGLRASMGMALPQTMAESSLADTAGSTGSRLGDMLGLRRGIAKVNYNPGIDKMTLGAGADLAPGDAAQIWGKSQRVYEPGVMGFQDSTKQGTTYVNLLDDPGLAPDLARATRRHEMYHGILDEALKTGDTAGLTPLQKAAHYLKSTADPYGTSPRDALSTLLNETGAHAAEQTSPIGQLLSGGKYLFGARGSPGRAFYANQLADTSPSIGALYKALGYAPEAGVALGGTGIGVGGGLAAYLSNR